MWNVLEFLFLGWLQYEMSDVSDSRVVERHTSYGMFLGFDASSSY